MDKLTSVQQAKFLRCLALGKSVTRACVDAGIPRRTAYYWRAEDISFKDDWDDAKAASVEELEDHLRTRAMDVNDKASHLLLMFLLKKLDPAYRDSYKAPEKGATAKPKEIEFTAEEVDIAMSILQAAKARPKDLP